MHDLFRKEALAAKGNQFLGSTVLRPPLSFATWSWIAAALAAAMIAFLVFGEYTKRKRVVGITSPEEGLIKLMASQPGIVVERRHQAGLTCGHGVRTTHSDNVTVFTDRVRGAPRNCRIEIEILPFPWSSMNIHIALYTNDF